MWVSEKEKRTRLIKQELTTLKRELVKKDLENLLLNANLDYRQEHGLLVNVPFFDEVIELGIPSFSFRKSRGNVDTLLKIVILKYLKNLEKINDEKFFDFVNLRELSLIKAKTLKSIERLFAYDAKSFLRYGIALGGKEMAYSDTSIIFTILPGVEILFVFREAEEEREAKLDVLVKKNIQQIFSETELLYLTKIIIKKILNYAKLKMCEDFL
ncbi:MAG: DUF3786 domain-containing protein [Deltaproteobacteria bacterium]|nr:DUF3786 domain-containing protein [Deltaproteobacteria bacterium]